MGLAVARFVDGVSGRNFAHMPELTWRYGDHAVLVAMATICLALYRLFKRSGWL
ncbi:CorA family divalent cation transporter [Egicoccus halophilus]|uniref:Uncharacterized protein n=1 Tax=Egicoccus halophilus TaxID=1670830 RepID=A0A8J3A8X5_9ACTN|nr:CorA family divalent cation transporter [Egicoccus halophilus]GGI07075.1 hypothetical protein GCM10011354_22280 [Egicoccus halophilus]